MDIELDPGTLGGRFAFSVFVVGSSGDRVVVSPGPRPFGPEDRAILLPGSRGASARIWGKMARMTGRAGFALGIVTGGLLASAGWGAYLEFRGQRPEPGPAPADASGRAVAEGPRARPRARPGARAARPPGSAMGERESSGAGEGAAAEPLRLTAADLRPVARGDDLSRPDVVQLDLGDGRATRELDQAEIDARFLPAQGEVLDCIARARPDDVTYIAGQVSVAFRITRAGEVRGVRVEAPAILHAGGLHACVRAVVSRLRFPASDASQVVTYPFRLS